MSHLLKQNAELASLYNIRNLTVDINIIIPAHNEESVISGKLLTFQAQLEEIENLTYEIIVIENGSVDGTRNVLVDLTAKDNRIVAKHISAVDYGKALKEGLKYLTSNNAFFMELDLLNINFVRDVLTIFDGYDLIVQSKRHKNSLDMRPFIRRLITLIFNLMLKMIGFEGTDTHGNKFLKFDKCRDILNMCELDGNLFATEFVIRCYKQKLLITELPIQITEVRPTSISIFKRIIPSLRDYFLLLKILR